MPSRLRFFYAARVVGARAVSVLAALAALGACSSLDDALSPGTRAVTAGPARLALSAEVGAYTSTATAAATPGLRVEPAYIRSDESRVPIGAQTVTLGAAATQQLPFSIDLTACLGDAQRKRAAGDDGACLAVIVVTLLDGATPVDQQTIGPLTLRAGGSTTVSDPIRLFQIASVRVASAGASTGGTAQVVTGNTVGLTTTLTSTTGQTVTGRPVTFQSDAPGIARVDPTTGVVTGVTPGRARITALAGTATGTIDVVVTLPPNPITIIGGVGAGTGTVRSSPAGIDCRIVAGAASGTCTASFAADAQVTLTATPDANSVFGVFGGACAGTTCTVDASQARTVSASFIALRRLTIVGGGTGSGTVISSGPVGTPSLNCTITAGATSGTCSVQVLDSTTVTLTGTPGVRQVFQGFVGACTSTTGTCRLTLTADATVTARFAPLQSVTVSLVGSGAGNVTIAVPSGAGTSTTCTLTAGLPAPACVADIPPGTVVTLTATPAPGSTFDGFTGACSSTGPCTLTVDRALTVGATFSPRALTLTLTVGGAGAGTVLVNGTAACALTAGTGSRTCTLPISGSTPLTLTAAAAPGSTFLGFTGACSGAGPCTITPSSDGSVGAAFAPIGIGLSVQGTPGATGSGTVTSSPSGISCSVTGASTSGSCSSTFPFGSRVTLTATPTSGSSFLGWGGECAGTTGPTCTVTLSSTVSPLVTVRFGVSSASLSLYGIAGSTGNGQVTSSGPAPALSCFFEGALISGACSGSYARTGTLYLTAIPNAGYVFSGFVGACTGAASNTCVVDLATAPTSSTLGVRFSPAVTLGVTVTDYDGPNRDTIFVTVGGVAAPPCTLGADTTTSRRCTYSVAAGATVQLTARPTSRFYSYDAPCVEDGGPICTFTASSSTEAYATFAMYGLPSLRAAPSRAPLPARRPDSKEPESPH